MNDTTTTVPDAVVAMITERFADRYEGIFSEDTIRRCIAESYGLLAEGATVASFLPLVTENFVAQRLRAVAHTEGKLPRECPRVLFVCDDNAGRSQVAAVLLQRAADGRIEVSSAAGRRPAPIDETLKTTLLELDVDLDNAFAKPLTDDLVRAADVVVTMGCGDACPVYPDKHYEDWDIDDPTGKPIEQVRAIRDKIAEKVEDLLQRLPP